MNKGFQLEIQKDLNKEEYDIAVKECNTFIADAANNNLTFSYLGGKTGGYKSYIRRGTFGKEINIAIIKNGYVDQTSTGLVFRRCSNNKRIFGIFREKELVVKHNYILNEEDKLKEGQSIPKMCMCPDHRGGIKVRWKNKKPETYIYAKIGEIKG